MKDYNYYPGCSLESTGKAYDISTKAVAKVLGITFKELEDWNCCGTTSYLSLDDKLAFALTARNLAIAEPSGLEVATPCSGCFATLNKTNHYYHEYPSVRAVINSALAAGGMEYHGTTKVRHLLDIMVNDYGEIIRNKVLKPLTGLKIAPYYGCQLVRPKGYSFDDPENPVTLDNLCHWIGATPVVFQYKVKCCGGSLMGTKQDLALRMSYNLLKSAQANGADILITTCPLCQMNLDAFQGKINKAYNKNFKLPVVYFTQLLGLALGIPANELALDLSIVPVEPTLAAVS
jgi:heterodisulfide reductase subunit B2